ncbi:hypothetical protein ACOQ27_003780 [Escherichia coli]|uniref:hypothetical protein n=1 Tax=Escherichia coli TaxID=562 RepID=UPI0018047D5F|nr:hypothetical protein [Escherichia coli]EFI1495410.1 hypothetical protein [Escherichia coli]ELD0413859.1 hypothetical protein [Escherichia coli]HCP5986182.1 hypothetical protein [Escherichia coli]
MKIYFEIKNKKILGDIDDYLDDELPPFQYCLEELRWYVDCEIIMELDAKHSIYLDLYSDFSLCFDEIIISIQRIKSEWLGEDYIWFCEQGRNIYLYYGVNETEVVLSYTEDTEDNKGGKEKKKPDFSVKINKIEYVNEWEKLFICLSELFNTKLGKTIEIPF